MACVVDYLFFAARVVIGCLAGFRGRTALRGGWSRGSGRAASPAPVVALFTPLPGDIGAEESARAHQYRPRDGGDFEPLGNGLVISWWVSLSVSIRNVCGMSEQTAEVHGSQIVAKEVTPDRALLLVRVAPTDAAVAVRASKGCTARVLRQELRYLTRSAKALWSPSYFSASVGYVVESTVRHLGRQWDAVAS
jgi:putative transposase